MMSIEYREVKEFSVGELEKLFLSVDWSSGEHPEKLQQVMKNSDAVYSAWDNDKLVGLINALSDGVMTTYFHYLLVAPDYQSKGIGSKLVELMLDKYQDYKTKLLIAYADKKEFYQQCGFAVEEDKEPMFVTDLDL